MAHAVRRPAPRSAAISALALSALLSGCAGRSATAPSTATPSAAASPASPATPPAATSAATATPAATPAAPGTSASAATASPSAPAGAAAPAGAFAEIHAGLEDASSGDCLGCHAELEPRIAVHGSHPVGLDLAAARAAAPGRYRSPEAIRAAGLALPDGKVECRTCHDLASPWRHRIALPAGAPARPSVVLGDPSTYGEDLGTGDAGAAAPAAGAEISAKPLCQSCHAL